MNFRGHLRGQDYSDPTLFELDVKTAGLVAKHPYTPQTLGKRACGEPPARLVLNAPEREWLGAWVELKDGRQGQVWALHQVPRYVWVVLDGQQDAGVNVNDLRKLGGAARGSEGLDALG